MNRTASFALLAAALIATAPGVAHADPITYTETATGTGTLDGVAFDGALITITATGDTSAITSPASGIYINSVTATVNVNNVTDTFTDSIIAFAVNGPKGVGISDTTNTHDILDEQSSSFASYDLSTSIGPITGDSGGNYDDYFATSLGYFTYTNLSATSTFTAVVTPSAVPEPSSLAMCGLAGLIGSAYAWRRRKRLA
jgi:hypothetical protein